MPSARRSNSAQPIVWSPCTAAGASPRMSAQASHKSAKFQVVTPFPLFVSGR